MAGVARPGAQHGGPAEVDQVVPEHLQREKEEGAGGAHDALLGQHQHVRLQTEAPVRESEVRNRDQK